jgi:hypothetical protein
MERPCALSWWKARRHVSDPWPDPLALLLWPYKDIICLPHPFTYSYTELSRNHSVFLLQITISNSDICVLCLQVDIRPRRLTWSKCSLIPILILGSSLRDGFWDNFPARVAKEVRDE